MSPPPPLPPTRIALLVCGSLTGAAREAHGDYVAVYTRYFAATAALAPGPQADPPFVLDAFDVVEKGEYPDAGKYDALVLTGSAASAYDPAPWVTALSAYLARVVDTHPRLKIIGICFGHQILARALGGACVPNTRWEVGPARVTLTELGRRVFGEDGGESKGDKDELVLQQMHRDHVPALPPRFALLAANAVSPVQGMVRFASASTTSTSTNAAATASTPPASTADTTTTDASNPTSTADASNSTPTPSPLPPIHILALQGHPEFPESLVAALVSARGASGAIDAATVAEYDAHGRGVADDGRGRVGRAIWGVMRGEM